MKDVGRLLIIAGVLLVVLGLAFTFSGRTALGRLPGDFVYRRGNVTLYFPLMTSILLSLLLTALFWLFRR
jgi:hypothetical protein